MPPFPRIRTATLKLCCMGATWQMAAFYTPTPHPPKHFVGSRDPTHSYLDRLQRPRLHLWSASPRHTLLQPQALLEGHQGIPSAALLLAARAQQEKCGGHGVGSIGAGLLQQLLPKALPAKHQARLCQARAHAVVALANVGHLAGGQRKSVRGCAWIGWV